MAEMNEREIRYQLTLDAQNAIKAAQEFREGVEFIKQSILELSQTSQLSFDDIAKGMSSVNFGGAREISTALKEVKSDAGETSKSFFDLGTIASTALGFSLGNIGVKAVQELIGVLKEATESTNEFSAAEYRIEVGVRGLERSGMDTTLKTWQTYIDQIVQMYPRFSKIDVTNAVAQTTLMTRNFGLAEEQMKNVINVTAMLAQTTGRDLNDAIRMVTYAMSSGYTRGLQMMGFNVTRATIDAELLKEGIHKSYIEVDAATRAQVIYNAIMNQASAIMDDAAAYNDTLAGKVQAQQAAWKNLSTTLGQMITPALKGINTFLAGFANQLSDVFKLLAIYIETSVSAMLGAIIAIQVELDKVRGKIPGKASAEDFVKVWHDAYQQLRMELAQETGLIPSAGLGELPGAAAAAQQQAASQATLETATELETSLDEILKDGTTRREQIELQYTRDVEDINIKHRQREEDAESEHIQRLIEIDVSRGQKRAEAQTEHELALAEEALRQQDQRAQAEQRYRDQELTAEARYQEKLLRLREGYLMSLEDAIRERNAKQIIQLTRRYNLEKRQAEREEANRKTEAKRNYDRELADAERQKNERLQILAMEFADRLRRIDLQRDQEIGRENLAYQLKRTNLDLDLKRDLEARKLNYDQALTDLQDSINNKMQAIIDAAVEEQKITTDNAQAVYNILKAYYGPGGYIEGLYLYYAQMMANLAASAYVPLPPGTHGGGTYEPTPATPGHAAGGSFIATKPTLIQYGEVPEIATFTPLSKLRRGGETPFAGGLGRDVGGKATIEVKLGEGLEARIIDNTLSSAADLILSVQRAN